MPQPKAKSQRRWYQFSLRTLLVVIAVAAGVVDLRPGDEFVHGPTQKQYKLTALRAYRQHQLSGGLAAAGNIPMDGYLVPR